MQLRIIGPTIRDCPAERAEIEQKVRLAVGSWAGHLERLTVRLKERSGPPGGLNIECRIEALPPLREGLAIHAIGSDVEGAVRGAVRQVLRRLKQEAGYSRSR